MKPLVCWYLMMLLTTVTPVVAAPLSAELEGGYQPLKAMEAEPLSAGFESALVAQLAKAVEREIVLDDSPLRADLRMGFVDNGPIYYSGVMAALTASETGPQNWAELAGQPICMSAGSPYLETIIDRFGAVAKQYPSAAQALIGLKLGECQAVVGDQVLLEQIARLPEWRRYNRLLPVQEAVKVPLRIAASEPVLQEQLQTFLAGEQGQAMLAQTLQFWIDEVAFQAYVLADTLDCH